MRGVNVSMGSLAWNLESLLKRPVFDETRLTNRYDMAVTWEAKDREHPDFGIVAQAVREQLGLDLTPARRAVEVLVVDQTGSGSRE